MSFRNEELYLQLADTQLVWAWLPACILRLFFYALGRAPVLSLSLFLFHILGPGRISSYLPACFACFTCFACSPIWPLSARLLARISVFRPGRVTGFAELPPNTFPIPGGATYSTHDHRLAYLCLLLASCGNHGGGVWSARHHCGPCNSLSGCQTFSFPLHEQVQK